MRTKVNRLSRSEPLAATAVLLVFGVLYFFILWYFLNQNGCTYTSTLLHEHSPPLYFMLAFVILLLAWWCAALVVGAVLDGPVRSVRFTIAAVNLVFALALGLVHYELWELISHQSFTEQLGLFPHTDGRGMARRLQECWQ